jgi:hypothetical protein
MPRTVTGECKCEKPVSKDIGYLTYCNACDVWWNPAHETHKCAKRRKEA